MASRCAAIVIVFAAACGGASAPPPTPATPTGEGAADASGDPTATCEPGRCLDDISRAIAEYRPDARACYDEGRKRAPTIEGKIIINFAIDAEGVVGETSQGMQDGQIEEPGVVECVSEVIKKVRFAKSPKGKTTRAYHRFEFSPN